MTMELGELSEKFLSKSLKTSLKKAFTREGSPLRVSLYNLAGSAASLTLANIEHGSSPMLVIGDSKDDAGYLYHDLSRLLSEQAVLVFPSAYKRDIKYGQIDPPSQVARTEALKAWKDDPNLKIVITYPEALAEGVATWKEISDHSCKLKVSQNIAPLKLRDWLLSQGFFKVDYVYEPGQFAMRGSIIDIFSYSNEQPYRIDFFGDEIDTIRTFDVETQLSIEKFDEIAVTANVKPENINVSLLEFISADTLIAFRNKEYTESRLREISEEKFSDSSLIADEGDSDAMKRIINVDDYSAKIDEFDTVFFSSNGKPEPGATAAIDFKCEPQGLYHKNFDLISDSFKTFLEKKYTIYILSDSAKQIERLHDIFTDRGDNISFTPIITTLHEGFVDNISKRCVFTDHQIFDRFHKYTLKSDRARSGKLALSLKELGAISPGDYIVHVDHGVGKFAGMVRTKVNGSMQEMIKLVYKNDDIIFVSIHSLHKLAKYRGKEGVPPKEQYTKIPYTGLQLLDLETTLMLQPDLIVGWHSTFAPKVIRPTDFWQQRGVNTFIARSSMIDNKGRTLQNEYKDILDLGKIFDKNERAQELVGQMQQAVQYAVSQTASFKQRPRALIVEFLGKDVNVYGEKSLAGDIVRELHGELLSPKEHNIGMEQIVDLDPDVIFVVVIESHYGREQDMVDRITQHKALKNLRCVKEGRGLPLPLYAIYSAGVRSYDGIKIISKGLYPDLYKEK